MQLDRTATTMPDLADFLAVKLQGSSYRQLEAFTGVSRGGLQKIINRQITKMPKVETLQRIADAYGLPLSSVVEMAGATLGDDDRALQLARELQTHPWLVERFDDLVRLSQAEFQEAMDYLAYRRKNRPGRNGGRSNP